MTSEASPDDDGSRSATAAVLRERHHLVNLAYRLLGSRTEAEDAVQETYARWFRLPLQQRQAIESPGAWLTKVASRVCLDVLGAARTRREHYVGEWIPEPLPADAGWASGHPGAADVDPADRVTLDESLGMAFLVMLESMTPPERVSFILHDVYGYRFAEVAEITGRSPAACRQLAASARRRVRSSPVPMTPSGQRATIVRQFKEAWEAKDIDRLLGLLAPEATAIGDGGGVVRAELGPIEGAERIAWFFAVRAGAVAELTLLERTVNGQPGLVAQRGGVTVAVYAFDIVGDRIGHIWAVLNPDKLRRWTGT